MASQRRHIPLSPSVRRAQPITPSLDAGTNGKGGTQREFQKVPKQYRKMTPKGSCKGVPKGSQRGSQKGPEERSERFPKALYSNYCMHIKNSANSRRNL